MMLDDASGAFCFHCRLWCFSWWLLVAGGGSWWLAVARGSSWWLVVKWLVVARGGCRGHGGRRRNVHGVFGGIGALLRCRV